MKDAALGRTDTAESTPHLTEEEIKAAFVRASNKALTDKDKIIKTFRLIRGSVFDTSTLERERTKLTYTQNIIAGLIQGGIYRLCGTKLDRLQEWV